MTSCERPIATMGLSGTVSAR